MEIWVEFQNKEWRISPDPAKVKLGTPVSWRFRATGLGVRRVKWTVVFHKSPFKHSPKANPGGPFVVSTETIPNENGQHIGTSPTTIADTPGDYKYDVRAENGENAEPLGNEDPYLSVA